MEAFAGPFSDAAPPARAPSAAPGNVPPPVPYRVTTLPAGDGVLMLLSWLIRLASPLPEPSRVNSAGAAAATFSGALAEGIPKFHTCTFTFEPGASSNGATTFSWPWKASSMVAGRSEEHTPELQPR